MPVLLGWILGYHFIDEVSTRVVDVLTCQEWAVVSPFGDASLARYRAPHSRVASVAHARAVPVARTFGNNKRGAHDATHRIS